MTYHKAGVLMPTLSSWSHPALKQLVGGTVTLKPLDVGGDIGALYKISHGTPEKESVWNYLFYGPFGSPEEMGAWYSENMAGKQDPLVWTVVSNERPGPVGVVSLLAIVPAHGRAEIGHVWLGTAVHRSKVNTETQYLLLKYLFDELGYRRVEWKCDALNHASRTAAARMGFVFEGRFRQHMVVRGRNRDTDWFAMTDKEWPRCRSHFERWLYSGEKVSLAELNHF
jgi:RimJ/RimL family protein N-acetyltransferase